MAEENARAGREQRKEKIEEEMAKENARAGREQCKEKIKEKMAKENTRAEREQREKKKKTADNHAKRARDQGHSRGGPWLARDMRRADTKAKEVVDTHTHMADSNRCNGAPKTGEWTCAAVKEDRIMRTKTQIWTQTQI
jgi:hypothetical protein